MKNGVIVAKSKSIYNVFIRRGLNLFLVQGFVKVFRGIHRDLSEFCDRQDRFKTKLFAAQRKYFPTLDIFKFTCCKHSSQVTPCD